MKLLSLVSLTLWFTTTVVWAQNNNGTEAQQSTWAGCYDSNRNLIKKGSAMFLCLHVGNSLDWSDGVDFIRLSFSPKSDEYSRLHIPNSYSDLTSEQRNPDFASNTLTVGVGVQESLSFLRIWKNDEKIYPHLTAIIDVRDGVVLGITWDDACIFCGGFQCDQITYDFNGNIQDRDSAGQPTGGCGITFSDCNSKHQDDGTDCDIVFYVVWTGTDVDGKALLSSANRFSAFPAQELSDRFTQNLPGAKDSGGDTTNRDL